MSNLIATDSQTQQIDSELIDLFEIVLPNGPTIYFHPGVDASLTNIKFRDRTARSNPVTAGGLSLIHI